jgi:hypothetical protein
MKDVHYGPVWDGKRYGSLCGIAPITGTPVMMGTDRYMVQCAECLKKLVVKPREEHPADFCERVGMTLD